MWLATAHVTNVGGERVRQLAFDEDVPLLRELRAQVRSEDSVEGSRAAVHVGDDVVEPRGCGAGPGRRVEDLSTFEVERRVLCKSQVLAGPFHVLHDPERAAHDPLVGRGPGGADTRLEATIEGIKE